MSRTIALSAGRTSVPDVTDAPETNGPATKAPETTTEQAAPDAEARQRHAELTERLDEARWRYHVLDAPTISDGEFDAAMRELNAIEDAFPALRTPDSPTQKVGGPPATTFAAVEHPMRLLSLDNVFNREELDRWAQRAVRELGEVHAVGPSG